MRNHFFFMYLIQWINQKCPSQWLTQAAGLHTRGGVYCVTKKTVTRHGQTHNTCYTRTYNSQTHTHSWLGCSWGLGFRLVLEGVTFWWQRWQEMKNESDWEQHVKCHSFYNMEWQWTQLEPLLYYKRVGLLMSPLRRAEDPLHWARPCLSKNWISCDAILLACKFFTLLSDSFSYWVVIRLQFFHTLPV